MQRSVQGGASDLDPRIVGFLARPEFDLEWRTDVKRSPPAHDEVGRRFLVAPIATIPLDRPLWHFYEPLKTRRLPSDFRELAGRVFTSKPTLDSLSSLIENPPSEVLSLIQTFANHYGFLGQPVNVTDANGGDVGYGEALLYWLQELATFWSLAVLWDRLSATSSDSELARRELEAFTRPFPEGGGRFLDIGTSFWTFDNRDPARKGRSLAAVLDERLRVFVAEQAEVMLAPLDAAKPLRIRPASVLAAIYLDLAMELIGGSGTRIRECDQCHRPYRASRSDSRYCSDTCRSNARHSRTTHTRRR